MLRTMQLNAVTCETGPMSFMKQATICSSELSESKFQSSWTIQESTKPKIQPVIQISGVI